MRNLASYPHMHDWHGKEIGILNPRDESPATKDRASPGEDGTGVGGMWRWRYKEQSWKCDLGMQLGWDLKSRLPDDEHRSSVTKLAMATACACTASVFFLALTKGVPRFHTRVSGYP